MLRPSLLILLTALGLPAAVPTPEFDIIPEGYRGVTWVGHLRLGSFAAVTHTAYTVREGDTLSKISQQRFGTTRHASAIQELNPGLDPRRMRIGEVVWLPPRQADPERSERFYAFFWKGNGPWRSKPAPFDPTQPLPFFKWGAQLLLVAAGHLDDLDALFADEEIKHAEALERASWARLSPRLEARRLVETSDPTREIRVTFELREAEVGEGERPRVELAEVETVRLDAKGRRIGQSSGEGAGAGGSGDERGQAAWLLGLALLGGGGGLGLLALRRRRASFDTGPAPAAASA